MKISPRENLTKANFKLAIAIGELMEEFNLNQPDMIYMLAGFQMEPARQVMELERE